MILSRYRITGHSMFPVFSENDNVLVSSIPFLFSKPKKGDVVIFQKDDKYYVKRIKDIKSGKYFLAGDNKDDSLDSRSFGEIDKKQIKGKVIIKI